MTLVGRFLVARKQAMSAMMPSDTRNYALFIKAFKCTQMLVRSKKTFFAYSLYLQGKYTKIISVEVVVCVLLTVTSKGNCTNKFSEEWKSRYVSYMLHTQLGERRSP